MHDMHSFKDLIEYRKSNKLKLFSFIITNREICGI